MTIIVSEVNEKVRFLCGGLTTSQLSDEILDKIINECIESIGSDDKYFCEVVYCSLIEALRYLIRKDKSRNPNASGDVKRRKEINGKRQIEVEYSTEGSSSSGWQSILDEFLNDPGLVCDSLISDDKQGLVIIGGVSEKEYKNVNGNPDSRNAYSLQVNKKYGRKVASSRRRHYYNFR